MATAVSAEAASSTVSSSAQTVPGPPAAVTPPPATPGQHTLLQQMQDAFTNIAKTAEPFVVNIEAAHALGSEPDSDDNPLAPSPPDHTPVPSPSPKSVPKAPGAPPAAPPPSPFPRQEQATGSGLIVRGDGYVLTNDHVVEGSPFVTVTLSDGREFRGKVIPDFRSDLALVKIDPNGAKLTIAKFADSDQVQPGQWAIAIGSPFDLQNTMTVGVISATHRHQAIGEDLASTRYYPDLIQTDAAINPGNSGGPLLNIDGEVVGVNVAIESPVEGSAGVGFAIPAKTALHIVSQLIANGKVVRGYLGLAPQDLTPAIEKKFGVASGAWVVQVDQDSPAGKAGLRATDVITRYNGQPVDGELTLRDAIAETAPGQTVAIEFLRNGKPLTASVVVAAPPPMQADNQAQPEPTTKVGITYRALTSSDRQNLSFKPTVDGVLVTSVATNSPADQAGLNENDVIEQIDHVQTTTVAQVTDALSNLATGSDTIMVVLRSNGGAVQEVALDIKM